MEENLDDLKIDKKCPDCNQQAYFDDRYDGIFCAKENKWLEKTCSDDKCEFCSKRPPTPLDKK